MTTVMPTTYYTNQRINGQSAVITQSNSQFLLINQLSPLKNYTTKENIKNKKHYILLIHNCAMTNRHQNVLMIFHDLFGSNTLEQDPTKTEQLPGIQCIILNMEPFTQHRCLHILFRHLAAVIRQQMQFQTDSQGFSNLLVHLRLDVALAGVWVNKNSVHQFHKQRQISTRHD
jgi:hypothetical protein